MRLGVVGLGSMGTRRVRDLVAQGHEVIGHDIRADRAAAAEHQFRISTVRSAEDLVERVEAVVISTPPDAHVPLYELCFKLRRNFFSEASIFTPRAEWFEEREQASGVKGHPSATWLFYPPFELLRAQLRKLGESAVLSLHHHYGGWLPYWHPWESYADFYAGRPLTAAVREMVPFEMEWVCGIAGPVRAVTARTRRSYEWETAIDDQYVLLLEFASGLHGTLIVELHQAAPFRVARISCAGNAFVLDFSRHEVDWYTQSSDSTRRLRAPGLRTFGAFNFEDVYAAEIAGFVAALADPDAPHKSWAQDRHLSNVLYAAEESSRRGATVTIAEAELLYDGLTL